MALIQHATIFLLTGVHPRAMAASAMTVLVTGANGFVGAALSAALLRAQVHARVAVRHPLAVLPGLEITQIDSIGPHTQWTNALQSCDTVIHLAARAHVMREEALDPLATYRSVNTEGTLHLARQAAAAGVRRFIFLSSIKVNGEATTPGNAFRASDTAHPEDFYGTSKWEAEQGLHLIAKYTGMEVVIIRPPLVYGSGVKANFAALLRAISNKLPLPLGAIHNLRSLVGLDNLVHLLLTCTTHPAAAQQTFLVSDGEDISTTELVRRIARATGKPSRLLPVPAQLLLAGARLVGQGAAAQRLCGNLQVDIQHTRDVLGWAPPVSLDEGLRRTVTAMQP
jgi:nucleoside-diphosphate-sugar epimerase